MLPPHTKGLAVSQGKQKLKNKIDLSLRFPDAWTEPEQPPETYFTTYQLAKKLKVSPRLIISWAQKWFPGVQHVERTGVKSAGGKLRGYRIPLIYEQIGRGWLQEENPMIREVIKKALSESPGDYVICVGNRGATCYTHQQVAGIIAIALVKMPGKPIRIYYVGDKQ
jgi:hypothetical protein